MVNFQSYGIYHVLILKTLKNSSRFLKTYAVLCQYLQKTISAKVQTSSLSLRTLVLLTNPSEAPVHFPWPLVTAI